MSRAVSVVSAHLRRQTVSESVVLGRRLNLLAPRSQLSWLRLSGSSSRRWLSTENAESTEEAQSEETNSPPVGPQTLFTAEAFPKLVKDCNGALQHGAMGSGGGLALGLLGIAPFTPPNPFMIGLLLAVLQVQFAHGYALRQLWLQQRRYVLEIVKEDIEPDEGQSRVTIVTIKCDGGLTRKIHLTPHAASGPSPSLADIVTKGKSFIVIDKAAGNVKDAEALDDLLQTDRGVLKEDLEVEPIGSESKEESGKLVQKFTELTREHLNNISGKEGPPPQEALGVLIRHSQLAGAGLLFGGLMLCVGGRQAKIEVPPQSSQSPQSR
eukprot:TRINITY_DN18227_c0_g1_i1.p1 TRINITY_DN18227_c0_g1~~TRINITY_DN18227_c0_g1_i1.p1  ORF type:complete len:324 (-),score=50.42 TRINITY_DN18227_c0_g1_i1:89-1060(-)